MTYPSPMPYQPAGGTEPYLLQMGDIGVTQHWVVTPQGTRPMAGSQWFVVDRAIRTQGIPVWAIVATIVTVWFFLLGLLFLLAKETRVQGFVEVTVRTEDMVHTTHLPVSSVMQIQQIQSQVAYAQHLASLA